MTQIAHSQPRMTSSADVATNLFAKFNGSVANFVAYRKTLNLLKALPTTTLIDLGLYSDDLKRVAREAAYSN